MRTHERVTLAMLALASVLAAVLALAEPRVQAVFTIAAVALLVTTLTRFDRTGGAMSSGFVSGGGGIAVGQPAAADVSPHWESARADPSIDGGSFSLAAGASPHPTR